MADVRSVIDGLPKESPLRRIVEATIRGDHEEAKKTRKEVLGNPELTLLLKGEINSVRGPYFSWVNLIIDSEGNFSNLFLEVDVWKCLKCQD